MIWIHGNQIIADPGYEMFLSSHHELMSTGNAENTNSVTHLSPWVAFISSQPPLDPVLGFNYTEYHLT